MQPWQTGAQVTIICLSLEFYIYSITTYFGISIAMIFKTQGCSGTAFGQRSGKGQPFDKMLVSHSLCLYFKWFSPLNKRAVDFHSKQSSQVILQTTTTTTTTNFYYSKKKIVYRINTIPQVAETNRGGKWRLINYITCKHFSRKKEERKRRKMMLQRRKFCFKTIFIGTRIN